MPRRRKTKRALKLDAEFYVVQFLGQSEELSVVHRSWIVFTKKPYECWWPEESAAIDVVTTQKLPNDISGWESHKCDLKLDAGTYMWASVIDIAL